MSERTPKGTRKLPSPTAAGVPRGWARNLQFAVRCAVAASLSQALAQVLGLAFPVWAALSALVVSQERLAETRASLVGRIFGTALGTSTAVAVHLVATQLRLQAEVTLFLAVALGASFARRWPRARSCMWTVAIILLSPGDGHSVVQLALWRGAEVLVGSVTGALVHAAADALLLAAMRRR